MRNLLQAACHPGREERKPMPGPHCSRHEEKCRTPFSHGGGGQAANGCRLVRGEAAISFRFEARKRENAPFCTLARCLLLQSEIFSDCTRWTRSSAFMQRRCY